MSFSVCADMSIVGNDLGHPIIFASPNLGHSINLKEKKKKKRKANFSKVSLIAFGRASTQQQSHLSEEKLFYPQHRLILIT